MQESNSPSQVENQAITQILEQLTQAGLTESAQTSAFHALGRFEITQPQYLQKLLNLYEQSAPGTITRTLASDILLLTEYYTYVLDDHLKILAEEYSIVTREKLIRRLGYINDERVVAALVKCLQDRSAHIRCTAAYILGEMGAISASAIEPLEKLRQWDKIQRSSTGDNAGDVATQSIRQIRWELGGDSAYLEKLSNSELTLRLFDDDWLVREIAAYLLGEREASDAIEPLIEALVSEKDATVLAAIAETLGNLKADRAFAPLLTELKCYNLATVWNVARALGNLGNELAINPLALALVEAKEIDGDAFWGGLTPFGEKVIPYMLELLKTPSNLARKAAAQVLYSYRETKEVFDALLTAFNDPASNIEVKSQIVQNLRYNNYTYQLDFLLELLEEPDEKIKEFAIEKLGKSENQQIVGRLLDLTAYPVISFSVTVTLVEALEKLGGPLAVAGIINLLKNNSSRVRKKAIQALGKLKSSQAIPALINILENGDSQERYFAIESLAQIGDSAALESLEYASMYDKGISTANRELVKYAATRAILAIKNNVQTLS